MLRPEYDSVELSEQELADAILEGKKRKYFKTKHQDYWAKLESPKGKTKVTNLKRKRGYERRRRFCSVRP